jgi:hypothetical protein
MVSISLQYIQGFELALSPEGPKKGRVHEGLHFAGRGFKS